MTDLVQDTEWQGKALELRTTGLGTSEIGEAVGKHPATIRKLFARNPESEAPDRVLSGAEASEAFEGQTTVDDFVEPENYGDEERFPDRDPLEDFRAEAGEAVGPMPPETPPEPGEAEHVLPLLKGTCQMALDLGPNAAPITAATVKFVSEKWPSGHFRMGDIVTGTFTARIVAIPAKEKFDKASGEYRAKDLDYGAEITEIEYDVGAGA